MTPQEQPAAAPITLRYHHVALACSDIATSKAFYEKVGFVETPAVPVVAATAASNKGDVSTSTTSCLMKNESGLGLHLFSTSRPHENNENVLMDISDKKYPGHTHMSFGVASVPGVMTYFEEAGIPLSGTRGPVAVFIRDPDRTTLEFERNDGGDDGQTVSAATLSQAPRGGIDHIGTRVSNPNQALQWYMDKLGFSKKLMSYELNENPLKNFYPFVAQTEHNRGENVDINLIPNATCGQQNVLLDTKQDPLPGILYAAYVIPDLEQALSNLGDANLIARSDADLQAWGLAPAYVVPLGGNGGKSCFVRDLDYNLFRLVELN